MDVKHLIAGTIKYGGVRVRGRVIEDPNCLFICCLNGFGLLGSNEPEGNEHCRVDLNSVIKQGSDNLLDQGDVFGGEKRVDVVVGSILYSGNICWTIPQVLRVLGALWDGVLEFMEGLF